ncbi:hypothetical protein CLAFUW4_03382 [Fulvia fulva]|uniref:Cytokinesis regulator n=1 Tax=Passalora fulva TaxID=5499 RepID=A0A9Q8LBK1_PASFU|nr:uncharacterized protein CLAFUR5_03362 [Fulvia fulva]KAK4632022.1 hypothetical protein CLAFUR4_03371 [Fulvia fulva]KAK4633141.1 hypothetical protein CLAFUR0_03376 [Fulvia fulva]UJO14366.1 hypothetical protein CLAFUR5_03362 [Fulvia fulva]WPV11707.1 hypothetical protein CLAFUW4_03382 [Fulvia fulva]WPV26139.1 hypothetical protein CLAFUW7_03374 [Fulvia fulva]
MATTDASKQVESWDDDDDFHGEFQAFAAGSTTGTAISSRLSVRSESVAGGDEDAWNVVLQPNDDQATTHAIDSAKQAGIPIPTNIPASALLGGTIKRLGKKKSKQKIDDDWDNDLEMSDQPLKLKPRAEDANVMSGEDMDDFDDLEGSLGIRFAGTKRDGTRARSSSASVMSPSLGSATADSEVDDFGGLELPEGPMDFEAKLQKRRAADAELSDLSQPSTTPALEQPATMNTNTHKKSKLESNDNDDFDNDFDLGRGGILDVRKRTTNKNVQVRASETSTPATQRPATTLNFHDRPTDKPIYNRSHIPRPVSGSKHTSRLDPVFESGASHHVRERRQPTTTSSQLLRSKRSMPVLRNQSSNSSFQRTPAPFLPAGVSNHQSSHVTAQRAMPYHLRRDSDPHRQGAQSPPPRPTSRLAHQVTPDTPSRAPRQRQDTAPASLIREAKLMQTIKKPARKRNFGDGSELEIFDDLPTSAVKESKFTKQPVARGPPKQGTLRRTQSRSEFMDPTKRNSAYSASAVPERMMTPAPPKTPSSPVRGLHDHTPSYLRDTAASRIARESRLVNQSRPRSEGPLQPLTTNWKAQVAARSPHSSPSANRQRSKRPALIAGIGGSHIPKSEKGMVYNPQTLRWEGNENTLAQFDIPPLETPSPSTNTQTSYMDRQHGPSTSPSRPALIAHVPTGNGHNIQVQNGMVYDPQQMKWLKVKGGRDVSGQLSPSVTDADDEEDAFAGIEDLKDENTPVPGAGGLGGLASPLSLAAGGAGELHEEFDLGPRFCRIQEEEEQAWRRKCEHWFVPSNEGPTSWPDNGLWRRAIRDIVPRDVDTLGGL